jgi:hypothetical protein
MSFSHLNAPATKLVDIRCCCCHTPLVDAVSTNLGIGPDCRTNHGFDVEVDEAARAEANKLIHMVAEKRLGDEVEAAVERIDELGFTVLAARIKERLAVAAKNAKKIVIKIDGNRLVLSTPFRRGAAEEFKAAMRNIPGRKWDGKTNSFPASSKRAVWDFLKEFFPGCFGTGPQGVFEIPKAKAA